MGAQQPFLQPLAQTLLKSTLKQVNVLNEQELRAGTATLQMALSRKMVGAGEVAILLKGVDYNDPSSEIEPTVMPKPGSG